MPVAVAARSVAIVDGIANGHACGNACACTDERTWGAIARAGDAVAQNASGDTPDQGTHNLSALAFIVIRVQASVAFIQPG